MIKILQTDQIDNTIINKQEIGRWWSDFNITKIIVANDNIANDEMRSLILKMSVPNTIEIVIKEIDASIDILKWGKYKSLNFMVIVNNQKDALKIFEKLKDDFDISIESFEQNEESGKETLEI